MPDTPPLPLLEGDWHVDHTHPDGVLVTLTLDGVSVRFAVLAEDARDLAEDLDVAADQWFSDADD